MQSSPISRGSPEPLLPDMLTPRSKVAKMLADIDNASSPPSPAASSGKASMQLEPSTLSGGMRSKAHSYSIHAGNDTDSSADEAVRPLGKAAQRMRSHQSLRLRQHRRSPSSARSHTASSDHESGGATPRATAAARSPSLTPTRSRDDGSDLFVSPAKSIFNESVADFPTNHHDSKARLAALVAQKRTEREARERERAKQPATLSEEDGEDEDASPEVDQVLSSSARPNRKASKKAMLEMTRETQRMAREQALAHDMKVKKKFTMADLLTRFNQRPAAPVSGDVSGEMTASSTPASDTTESQTRDRTFTPPSSPPPGDHSLKHRGLFDAVRDDGADDEELPDVHDAVRQSQLNKTALSGPEPVQIETSTAAPKVTVDESSDDDLEVLQPLPPHLRVFDRIKVPSKTKADNSCKAIHTLRHLSSVGAHDLVPRNKNARPTVRRDVLEVQLRRKAKEQARQEQLERINELKAKGVVVQSAEEREREAEVYENLLEKARQEALDLRQAEKALRKNKKGDDDVAEASEDESEDEDYVGSGSDNDADDDSAAEDASVNALLDDVAAQGSGSDQSQNEESDDDDHDTMPAEIEVDLGISRQENSVDPIIAATEPETSTVATGTPSLLRTVRPRITRVIEDDDDEEEIVDRAPEVALPTQMTQATPVSKVDPFAIFETDVGDSLLMSPTQAFNATMQTPTQFTQTDSLDVYRQTLPSRVTGLGVVSTEEYQDELHHDSNPELIPGSQVRESQQVNLLWETQAPETPRPNLARGISTLTETPGWEPSQDRGLPSPWSARIGQAEMAGSLLEHETQSTVRIRVSESPAPSALHKRGRLVRRRVTETDEESGQAVADTVGGEKVAKDAFKEMSRRRRVDLTTAERDAALGEMKGMMDDQAEESDDEYAGLGGDDYIAPETEEDKAMIDSSHVDVDERALAAHFAERQRLMDEAETSKLYKDLTTGALRRKQANMFDLEDDEDELAARRRQIKQQEEARKRRLLLQDDNIAGLAEGKQSIKKDAFLKAIADDDEQDDMYDLSDGESERPPETQESNVPDSQQPKDITLQEVSGNKRPLQELYDKPEDRPPAKLRRTQISGVFRKPASLLEVKESVSFLLDEPNAVSYGPSAFDENIEGEESDEMDMEADTDDNMNEQMEKDRANDGGFAPDRPRPSQGLRLSQSTTSLRRTEVVHATVVDRISLKRSSSNSTDVINRSAWAMASSASFKVPSLLRRATTNLGVAAANDRGVSTTSLSRESSSTVKMGGSKKSSLAYQARAEERMAIVEASAKRRQENTAKIAQLRRHSTAGGLLGRGLGGHFE